jgi:2-haloacid dehalogenase
MRLTDFKLLTFDCYGTLIDWETGIVDGLGPLIARLPAPAERDRILEAHARHEAQQQRYTPEMTYRDVLAVVYRRLAEEWRVPYTFAEANAYGDSVRRWPVFPDTVGALQYLRRFYRIAVLSNVDNATFAESLKVLGVEFDAVFTAEDVGLYKPDRRFFEYMLNAVEARGFRREEILHTAESLYHDLIPANEVGLPSCWIYRRFEKPGFGATIDPGMRPQVDFQYTSMAQLASAHHEELIRG